MLPVAILVLCFSRGIREGEAIDYVSTGVVREKVTVFENPRIALEAFGSGDDRLSYLTIIDPITQNDNFSMSIVATRHDGVEFSIPGNPINLCELLSDEAENVNKPLTQFRMSRIFNMEGATCPISSGTKRLMPYMFPPKISLQNDIGCGTFTYQTTIQSCQGQKAENCMPFITASTDVYLSGDHCSNTLA